MFTSTWHVRIIAVAILTVLLAVPTALAQHQSGNLHGTVRSDEGDLLPGVTVELSGLGATLARVTDTHGLFHFVGLAPGSYRLAATLEGFSAVVHETVTIRVGRNTGIDVTMLSAVEELITVTAESPSLDERKISAGATVNQTELEKIPTARDPWVVLLSVPGVLTSDVNVGGNKSGYQQRTTGTGAGVAQNTFAVDGVDLTDLNPFSTGWSNWYYDFGSFEEIEVSTGGSDMSRPTAGVALNVVTKRGTNEWRGSTRYIVADDSWQSGLSLDASELGPGQEEFAQGDRIVKVEEYGLEGGGRLIADRLWLWGHYGKNDIDRLTIYDVRDFTELEYYGFKLNLQATAANSAVAQYSWSAKTVDGRGAGPTRPEPTTWDQYGPGDFYKLEDTHVVNQRLFLTGLVSDYELWFRLTPKGGLDGPITVWDEDFIWQHNNSHYASTRTQKQANAESNLFLGSGDVSHELRFGLGYREATTEEVYGWPGDMVRIDAWRRYFGLPVVQVTRQELFALTTKYTSLFAQDTLRVGRLTANLGLRFDRQQGRQDPATVPGVEGFETLPDGTPLLPGVTYEGRDQGFTWDEISPRLGLTYALGKDRQTLLRASYSRFAQQLGQWYAYMEWPLGAAYAYFFYEDTNGDGDVTVDEIIFVPPDGYLWTNGYDPLGQTGPYDVDPDLESEVHDEAIVAVEHAFLPELVLGLSATWHQMRRFTEYERLVEVIGTGEVRPHRRGDYELLGIEAVTLPDGSTSEVPVYGLRSGLRDTGREFVTDGDRGTDYLGVSLTLDKRLADRWMLRGHLTWSDWTWDVPESEREDPNLYRGGFDDDGGPVVTAGITPGWSYRLGGLVRIAPDRRWGFDLAANIWGREGYAIPYFTGATASGLGSINLQATDKVDDYRYPSVNLVDLRIDKELRFKDFSLTIGVECFNALNESTVLDRNERLGVSTTNYVYEVISPRIFRLNTRLSFR